MIKLDLDDIRAQFEHELTWRCDEIRMLHNQLAYITHEEYQRRFRKALVLMLYAHYEGFCHTALLIYVSCINETKIQCYQANEYIAAASMADIFRAYENTDAKCQVFARKLPDDTQLHRFARQADFVASMEHFQNETVCIPDDVVDTQSNLWPVILRKNMFRIGLPHDVFAKFEGSINRLLNHRNGLAHGMDRDGLEEQDYLDLERTALTIMENLILILMEALKEKRYLKAGVR